MAVIAKVLNGTNLTRDAGIQEIPSAMLHSAGGVRKGYKNNCLATSGQVDTGMIYVPVTRTVVTPNEQFLVCLEITEPFTLDTSGNGYIIASVNASKVNDGSSNSADGSGIGTIEKVGSLPSSNYTLIATIASGVVTYAPKIAHFTPSMYGQSPFVYADIGVANAYQIVDDRVVTLEDGYTVEIKAAHTNAGGASTLQVNNLPAKSIRKAFNQVLDATDIQGDQFITLRYDATNGWFQMLNTVGNPSSTPNITVRVSSNDTTSGYLNGKLVAGNRVTLTEDNDGSNETLTIGFNKSTPYTAGETLVADDWVYIKASDNKVYKGDRSTVEKATIIGVVTVGGTANNTVYVQESGVWTPSSYSLTAQTPIYLSGTAGAPTTTEPARDDGAIVPVQLGVPSSTTRMKIDIKRFQRVKVFTGQKTQASGSGTDVVDIGFIANRVDIFAQRETLTGAGVGDFGSSGTADLTASTFSTFNSTSYCLSLTEGDGGGGVARATVVLNATPTSINIVWTFTSYTTSGDNINYYGKAYEKM